MAERSKKEYVSDETFAELMESAEQALRYERGERGDCRVIRVIQKQRCKSLEETPAKSPHAKRSDLITLQKD